LPNGITFVFCNAFPLPLIILNLTFLTTSSTCSAWMLPCRTQRIW
jgi:hypothetical protein